MTRWGWTYFVWRDVWEWEDGGVQNHTRAEYGNTGSQQDTIKHRWVLVCVRACVCVCGVFQRYCYCSMVANVSEIWWHTSAESKSVWSWVAYSHTEWSIQHASYLECLQLPDDLFVSFQTDNNQMLYSGIWTCPLWKHSSGTKQVPEKR